MNATNPATSLSLHSLLEHLEASDCIAVTDHEFDELPAFPWIALEAGEFSLIVNLSTEHRQVTVDTSDHRTLYSKSAGDGWEQSLLAFLAGIATAAETV